MDPEHQVGAGPVVDLDGGGVDPEAVAAAVHHQRVVAVGVLAPAQGGRDVRAQRGGGQLQRLAGLQAAGGHRVQPAVEIDQQRPRALDVQVGDAAPGRVQQAGVQLLLPHARRERRPALRPRRRPRRRRSGKKATGRKRRRHRSSTPPARRAKSRCPFCGPCPPAIETAGRPPRASACSAFSTASSPAANAPMTPPPARVNPSQTVEHRYKADKIITNNC